MLSENGQTLSEDVNMNSTEHPHMNPLVQSYY